MAGVAERLLAVPLSMVFDPATGGYKLQIDTASGAVSVTGTVNVLVLPGENHIGEVGGRTVIISGGFVRPAATGTYDANDGVTDIATGTATAIEFRGAARVAGGSGLLNWVKLVKNHTNTTNATYRLWLYRDVPANVPLDGATFQQAWANRSVRIGYVDFSTAIAGSDCVDYFGTPVFSNEAFVVATGSTSLYGILQVLGAYAPGANERFLFLMGIFQD